MGFPQSNGVYERLAEHVACQPFFGSSLVPVYEILMHNVFERMAVRDFGLTNSRTWRVAAQALNKAIDRAEGC